MLPRVPNKLMFGLRLVCGPQQDSRNEEGNVGKAEEDACLQPQLNHQGVRRFLQKKILVPTAAERLSVGAALMSVTPSPSAMS